MSTRAMRSPTAALEREASGDRDDRDGQRDEGRIRHSRRERRSCSVAGIRCAGSAAGSIELMSQPGTRGQGTRRLSHVAPGKCKAAGAHGRARLTIRPRRHSGLVAQQLGGELGHVGHGKPVPFPEALRAVDGDEASWWRKSRAARVLDRARRRCWLAAPTAACDRQQGEVVEVVGVGVGGKLAEQRIERAAGVPARQGWLKTVAGRLLADFEEVAAVADRAAGVPPAPPAPRRNRDARSSAIASTAGRS